MLWAGTAPCQSVLEAADLVQRLLVEDPKQRLGSGPTGADEIKNHPFFQGVDWAAVREMVPPKCVEVTREAEDEEEETDFLEIAPTQANLSHVRSVSHHRVFTFFLLWQSF